MRRRSTEPEVNSTATGNGNRSAVALTHSRLLHDIRLALTEEPDCVLWHNPNGVYLTLDGRRKVRVGLIVGALDLVGIGPGGRWLAIDAKVGRDRLRPEQKRFIALVESRGGTAGAARSVEEAWALLELARKRGKRVHRLPKHV